jgi:DNA invertase Pin-like site-specific DNA recombinase
MPVPSRRNGKKGTETLESHSSDALTGWLQRPQTPPSATTGQPPAGIRFAFYGRTSTTGFQDEASSRQWQYDNATRVIAGAGTIVAEFFDVGYSRSLPWTERPEAAALLRAVSSPDRAFDAIVVGEYERAFSGDQLLQMLPRLRRHGISVWLPELDGPVDGHDPAHRALVRLLGDQSRREVLRARFRTREAMRVQVRDQGRYLGGRPPYGYRLEDAGPHPNKVHAGWGRRLWRLDPDPVTAPVVRWMFAHRLAGHSTAAIALTLHRRGVPSPAVHDHDDHTVPAGTTWSARTVATILSNPRYTGRQVWNRHRTDHQETLPGDKHTSTTGPVRRANARADWVISEKIAHPPLVSEADFVRAQQVRTTPTPQDSSVRRYRLTGLVICGSCGRRAEAHWVHDRAGYRCRHGQASGAGRPPGAVRTLYVREDTLLEYARTRLGIDTPEDRDTTLDEISGRLRTQRMTFAFDGTGITLQGPEPHGAATPPRPPRQPQRIAPCRPLTRQNVIETHLIKATKNRPSKGRLKCRCKPPKMRFKSRPNPRRG